MTDVDNLRPLFDGRKLRLARDLRQMSQRGIAERLDVTPIAISQFERGEVRPSRATLARIAKVTDFPIDFFVTRGRGDEEVPGYFRSLRSTPASIRRMARAKAQLLAYVARALERHVRFPTSDVPVHPVTEETSREEIEEIAAYVRRVWDVDDGPVDNVARTLERHGVITARVHVDSTDIDAFSVPFSDHPVVVLGRDKGVRVRSRMDAAHELGHLVMHAPEQYGTKIVEAQASQFAAAFLMPADQIEDELPRRVEWGNLMQTKMAWGVSLASLLFRARTLGAMSEQTYVQAMKALSARGWRRREPGDNDAPEEPSLVARAVALAEERGTTLEDLAAEAGLPVRDVQELIDTMGDTRPSVDL